MAQLVTPSDQGKQMENKVLPFRCFFCGAVLTKTASPNALTCNTCSAVFEISRNERTCVTHIIVRDCGSGPECCQKKNDSSTS